MATTTAIKLTGEELFEISVIDHSNPYKNGQRAKDKKTFSRFRYEGTVFTVDSDNPFVQDFIAGNVKSVKLQPGERELTTVDAEGNDIVSTVSTLTFDSHVNRAQYNSMQADRVLDAGVEYKIKRYEHLATAPVTAALLEELENSI